MPAYPDIARTTSVSASNRGRTVDISDSGSLRMVDVSAGDVHTITITHPLIVTADRDTIRTFYTNNRTSLAVTYTHGGGTYTGGFEGPPSERQINATRWEVTSVLVTTKTA